jgi:hypothetical protein
LSELTTRNKPPPLLPPSPAPQSEIIQSNREAGEEKEGERERAPPWVEGEEEEVMLVESRKKGKEEGREKRGEERGDERVRVSNQQEEMEMEEEDERTKGDEEKVIGVRVFSEERREEEKELLRKISSISLS